MILISIGANLPSADGSPPIETCRVALSALRSLPGLRVAAASRWYRTAPIPVSEQPDFINGVARLEGTAEPAALLGTLQRLEAAAGRRRGAANAARSLDLDIIDIDGMIRPAPDPVLPHPRAHERGFVLVPLAEVAPSWVHPVLGEPVAALIAALPPQRLAPL